ncbi:MAG: BsuPI-related putative proteinase inhibitor [bacterium]
MRSSDETPEVIRLNITGGIAGINQELIVRQNGFIEFQNNFPFGGSYTDALTSEEFASLHSLFLDNNFTRLNERYVTENTADFIYYEITFIQDDLSKTVFADHSAAPLGLKTIIEHLKAIIQNITQDGLQFRLEVSKDSLRVGEPAVLKLIVKNISGQNIALHFQDGQRFNFFAQGILTASPDSRIALQKLWNWDQDKVFDQATHTIDLPAGNALEFVANWDGADNNGSVLSGNIWVGGELVSTPGGTTPMIRVVINE